MSFNSKKTIAGIGTGALMVIAYIIYALGKHAPTSEDLKSWAISMLLFIGIGVVAGVVIQILFHILFAVGVAVKERDKDDKAIERIISLEVAEDERDKLVGLKSSRICVVIVGVGFIAALVGLVFGISSVFALHILLGSFSLGSIADGFVSVYFYEKGVHNG